MILGDYKIITIKTGRLSQNCYLIRHNLSEDLLLIDPGDDAHHILEIIEREGSRLKFILLTHAHYDHVGAIKIISEKFQLPFFMHKDDLKLFNRAPTYALAFENKSLEISKNYLFFDKEKMNLNGHEISITHVPGHTPGGVCIQVANFAFTGDTLLKEFPSQINLPGENLSELRVSIEKILTTLKSDAILFPGHGRAWSVEEASKWWSMNQPVTHGFKEKMKYVQ